MKSKKKVQGKIKNQKDNKAIVLSAASQTNEILQKHCDLALAFLQKGDEVSVVFKRVSGEALHNEILMLISILSREVQEAQQAAFVGSIAAKLLGLAGQLTAQLPQIGFELKEQTTKQDEVAA